MQTKVQPAAGRGQRGLSTINAVLISLGITFAVALVVALALNIAFQAL